MYLWIKIFLFVMSKVDIFSFSMGFVMISLFFVDSKRNVSKCVSGNCDLGFIKFVVEISI